MKQALLTLKLVDYQEVKEVLDPILMLEFLQNWTMTADGFNKVQLSDQMQAVV